MIKIMFVCHGNICRSTMAEFWMKHVVKKAGREKEFYIASSATSTEEIGNSVHHGTRKKLAEFNISTAGKQAVQLTKADYEKYDYFLGMDSANIRNMLRIFKSDPANKVYRLLDFTDDVRDIRDPWYTGNFDETFEDVSKGIDGLLQEIDKSE
ncbi:MAG: low molecular weight phosphotyrosine protein phosphatase [Clostridia bacterium]|nr:low molecular weight phosphotyrosine protein phosphatase [Clostridia bacterium]